MLKLVDHFGLRTILVCGLLILLSLGFVRISLHDMRASDDNIWLFSQGLALTRDARTPEDPEIKLTTRVREAGADHRDVIRYEMRTKYRHNYLMATLLWGGVASLINRGAGTVDNYARRVAIGIFAGSLVSQAMAALALVVGLLATRRIELIAAAFGGVALLLALTFAIPGGSSFLFWELSGLQAIENALLFALHPHPQFSIFGFTPRSQHGLLVLLAFVLRWRGWIGAGYAVLALGGLVHQSMATLIFAIVLMMDLLLRPGELTRRSVWPFLVLGALLISVRETLWNFALAPGALLRVLLLAGSLAVFAGFIIKAAQHGYVGAVSSVRARIAAAPLYQVDALALGCGWLITLPLGYILAQYADANQRLYFWDQAHARTWLLIAPAIATGIALALWRWLARTDLGRWARERPLTTGLTAVLVVVIPLTVVIRPLGVAKAETRRLENDMVALGRQLGAPIAHPPTLADEALLYLGLAHERDTGEPSLDLLLPPTAAKNASGAGRGLERRGIFESREPTGVRVA